MPLLMLLGARLPHLLLPDTPRWRAWVDALHAGVEGYVPQLSFVAATATVEVEGGATLSFVDVRRPMPTQPVSPFDTSWLSSLSGAAISLVRSRVTALPLPPLPDGTAAAACDAEKEAKESSVAAPKRRRTPQRVVYISRNDSTVRRVQREGKLLDVLRAAARVDGGWELRPVLLSELELTATRALFDGAAVVVGPHGAGLFNAPLFAPNSATLVAFGLRKAEANKEDNLKWACEAVGMRMVGPPGVAGPFMGDYTLSDRMRQAVVASVREALRR